MALANYAASGLDEKTAYLELNGHGEIGNWKHAGKDGYFTDLKIHYYPNLKKEAIPIILNRDYERIIMDFGDAYDAFREEMLRCERKVFLLNLNFWQKYAAEKMADSIQGKNWGGIQPFYASMGAQEEVKKAMEKEYGMRIYEIPFIPNSKHVRAEEFECMDFILGRSVAKTKRKKSLIPFKRK